jgi:hypothetical protein
MAFDLTKNMPKGIKENIQESKTRIENIENSKGAANGIASLDSNGKIPITQIPDTTKLIRLVRSNLTSLYALTIADVQFMDLVYITSEQDTFQLIDESNISNSSGWIKIQLSNSDDLAEGSSNLFFTDSRAKSAVVTDMSGGETDKSPSVSSVKNYINTSVSTSVKSFIKKNTSGTLLSYEEKVYCNITSADITITLPDVGSTNDGESHTILNRSSSTKNVIVNPSGSVTIDGAASLTILPSEYVTFIYEHSTTNWILI